MLIMLSGAGRRIVSSRSCNGAKRQVLFIEEDDLAWWLHFFPEMSPIATPIPMVESTVTAPPPESNVEHVRRTTEAVETSSTSKVTEGDLVAHLGDKKQKEGEGALPQ